MPCGPKYQISTVSYHLKDFLRLSFLQMKADKTVNIRQVDVTVISRDQEGGIEEKNTYYTRKIKQF